jgi:hypothetical protein
VQLDRDLVWLVGKVPSGFVEHSLTEIDADDALAAERPKHANDRKVGYELLGKRGQPQVAELVLGSNAQTHAQSDNAQDSYGEVLLGAKKPAERRPGS